MQPWLPQLADANQHVCGTCNCQPGVCAVRREGYGARIVGLGRIVGGRDGVSWNRGEEVAVKPQEQRHVLAVLCVLAAGQYLVGCRGPAAPHVIYRQCLESQSWVYIGVVCER